MKAGVPGAEAVARAVRAVVKSEPPTCLPSSHENKEQA
ncbi:MAG: hypothetical protein JWN00_2099 [Actinomycetia bacterium]|jgi:hypothetical protein|nr:hypothetical protein [Actinomycetes bacterium]